MDEKLLQKICDEVEREEFIGIGGLSSGLYADYAKAVAKKYFQEKGGPEMFETLKVVYSRAVKNGVVTTDDLRFSEIEKVRETLKKAGINMMDK